MSSAFARARRRARNFPGRQLRVEDAFSGHSACPAPLRSCADSDAPVPVDEDHFSNGVAHLEPTPRAGYLGDALDSVSVTVSDATGREG
eukprot:2794174-Pyramimonas_sp.AAC.1